MEGLVMYNHDVSTSYSLVNIMFDYIIISDRYINSLRKNFYYVILQKRNHTFSRNIRLNSSDTFEWVYPYHYS